MRKTTFLIALVWLSGHSAHAVCTPVEQWRWEGPVEAPLSPDPCISPLVVHLTDDDGDGRIDANDIPDVAFIHWGPSERGLTVLDGLTGSEHFTIAGLNVIRAGLAAGDLDGDGIVELVVDEWTRMLVYEHDGTLKLTSDEIPLIATDNDTIGIADLDQDGTPEMFVGASVVNADGSIRFQGLEGRGAEPRYHTSISNAVDLDPTSPGLELLAGRTAYAPDGSIVWNNTGVADGFTAVADFDGDGDPEIVLATAGPVGRELYLLDHQGMVLGSPHTLPELPPPHRPLSAPLVADLDGDGAPEVFLASGDLVEALDWTGTGFAQLWSMTTRDRTGLDGASAFDFDGDGASEVIYHDELSWFLLDGRDGSVLSELSSPSATVVETPVIADIDNDCKTEILISGCDGSVPEPSPQAVIAYECDAGQRARPIWNQHQYHVTNVEDDGTIPVVEPGSWSAGNGNGWLAQQAMPCGCDVATTPGDVGNTLRAVRVGLEVWMSWASVPDAETYNLYRGVDKRVWPPLPLLTAIPGTTTGLPDVPGPPFLYLYRSAGVNCRGIEGPR